MTQQLRTSNDGNFGHLHQFGNMSPSFAVLSYEGWKNPPPLHNLPRQDVRSPDIGKNEKIIQLFLKFSKPFIITRNFIRCRESAVVMACYLYNPYLNKIGDGEVKNGEHPITACRFHAHLVSLKKTIQRK
ncbi:hypothetical protein J6590_107179, partial [Homalodisca vitripennis]